MPTGLLNVDSVSENSPTTVYAASSYTQVFCQMLAAMCSIANNAQGTHLSASCRDSAAGVQRPCILVVLYSLLASCVSMLTAAVRGRQEIAGYVSPRRRQLSVRAVWQFGWQLHAGFAENDAAGPVQLDPDSGTVILHKFSSIFLVNK